MDSIIKSQSLVNEGRFPHEEEIKEIMEDVEDCRNPSLMRAGFHILFSASARMQGIDVTCRNPSLMRAGFHNEYYIEIGWRINLVAIPR